MVHIVHLFFFLLILVNLDATEHIDTTNMIKIDCELTPIRAKSKYRPEEGNNQFTTLDQETTNEHAQVSIHQPIPSSKIRFGADNSTNWCGYASLTNAKRPAANSVSAVHGTWVVPTVVNKGGSGYTSLWVGIDGYGSNTVEQIGTEHDWTSKGQINYAWFEMYPQYPYEITGFPMSPGDVITGSVVYTGNYTFKLSLYNQTKNIYTEIPTSYTKSKVAQRKCAEWIVEAPSTSQGPLPLSDYQTAVFTNCTVTINNVTGSISNPRWVNQAITMITKNNVIKSSVSSLSGDGKSFTTTWRHQ